MSLQQAADNLIWLILASVLPVLLVGIVWVLLPKYVRRALKWLDDLIPGDFSALHRPASVAIAIAVSIAIIVPAAIAVIWGIGGNVDDTLQVSADFGRDVGRWAGDEGVKILIVLFITFLFQRFGTRTIPKAIESYIQQGSRNEQQVLEAELEKRIKTLSGVMVKAFSVIVVLGSHVHDPGSDWSEPGSAPGRGGCGRHRYRVWGPEHRQRCLCWGVYRLGEPVPGGRRGEHRRHRWAGGGHQSPANRAAGSRLQAALHTQRRGSHSPPI